MEYPAHPSGPRPTGWIGWVAFAAAILVIVGTFTALQGLAGIFRDETYFVGGQVLVFDYTAWGWIHLGLGLLLVVVGVALTRGSVVARGITIGLVGLNLVAQFVWIGANPWWGLIAITLNVLVLYALIVHGGELDVGGR